MSLLRWHRALAEVGVNVLALALDPDRHWRTLKLAAHAGDPWGVEIAGPMAAVDAPLYDVFVDNLLLTHRMSVTWRQTIEMVAAVVAHPRGNVGSAGHDDWPPWSVHVRQLVAPWQGPP